MMTETALSGHTDPLDLKPSRFWLAAVLIFLPLFLVGQRHPLWRTSDARVIEIAREMHVSGNYAVPHFNNEVFLEKPPLFFATMALSFRIFGKVSEGVARIPCALFALIGIMAAVGIGRRLRGQSFGLVMGFIMASTFLYLKRGHSAYLDISLAAVSNLCLLCFLHLYSREKKSYSIVWLVLFYLLLTITFYIKGLVGMMVPVLCIVSFVLWMKDPRGLFRLRPVMGIFLFLVLTLPWHLELWRQGGLEYLRIFYLENHLYRFIRTDQSVHTHQAPWYWYLKTIWKFYRPWSLFFIPAGAAFFRRPFREWLSERNWKFLLCWLVPAFILFSFSSTKREDYLLPLYGAFAGGIAAWVLFRADPGRAPRWEQAFIWVLGIGLASGSVALPVYCYRNSLDSGGAALILLILLVPSAGLTLYTLIRASRAFWIAALINAWILALGGVIFYLPLAQAEYDHSAFSRKVAQITRDTTRLYSQGPSETTRGFINFYTGKFLVDLSKVPDLKKLLESQGPVYVVQVYRSSKQIQRKISELEQKGVRLEVVLKEEVKPDRFCVLWLARPAQEPTEAGTPPGQ
jgi:4-amino-4-deoxy-L-arabinose transferase-like glycosyltransferase